MTVLELIRKRRTIRRFKQDKIPYDILTEIVDAARLAPSASNLQPLEFILVEEEAMVQRVFEQTRWAAYLPRDIGYPPVGQIPVAFIVMLINRDLRQSGGGQDIGAAGENMILTALEKGIGACWIASIDRDDLRSLLKIPDNYEIDTLLAFGYPAEDPVAEPLADSVKYYKDSDGRLHVPKRSLESVLHHNAF